MRQALLVVLLISIMLGILYGVAIIVYPLIGFHEIIRPVITSITVDHTLDIYSIENLRLRMVPSSTISFDRLIDETKFYNAYEFSYFVEGDRVTGLAHIPKNADDAPVIVMFRGYVDLEIYESGVGTKRAGEAFANAGYITLAPDFLGFGGSDMPSEDPIEERFQRYTTSLTLLDSIAKINNTLTKLELETSADISKIAIWGHSNGGHISLVMLEVTGKKYPTTLWAPVTKPFPYSILYYTDDSDDHGKALRKVVADFESDYDVEKYSLTNYLDWIQGSVLLHQGGIDDAVPQAWSDKFYQSMKDIDKDITYYTYPGNDHNFAQGAWNTVVQRDLSFFEKNFN